MRIGLVSFHNIVDGATLRGTFTTLIYMKQHLEYMGFEVDLILISESDTVIQPNGYRFKYHIKNPLDCICLKNKYDFIIYQTPGISLERYDSDNPNKYIPYLENINTDFGIIYHSEVYDGEPGSKPHQPYKSNFINNEHCKLLIFMSPGYEKLYSNDVNKIGNYVIATMCPMIKPKSYVLNKLRNKLKTKRTVAMTAAWTTFKKQREYLCYSKLFNEANIDSYIYGSPSSTFYVLNVCNELVDKVELIESPDINYNKLDVFNRVNEFKRIANATTKGKTSNNFDTFKSVEDVNKNIIAEKLTMYDKGVTINYGGYKPEDIPFILSNVVFLWAVVYYKISSKTWCPRLETNVFEALNEGCLPILCSTSSADYVQSGNSALLVDKKEESQIDLIKSLKYLTDDEIINRVSKLYDEVYYNVHIKMYGELKRNLMSLILED